MTLGRFETTEKVSNRVPVRTGMLSKLPSQRRLYRKSKTNCKEVDRWNIHNRAI